MRLIVDRIYNARRVVKEGEDSERHWTELKAYLIQEVSPQGLKFERNGNEVVVIGYCGSFEED